MHPYSPEGIWVETPTAESIVRGERTQEIFCAMCVKCDEFHNLHVDLGKIKGIIPHDEATPEISTEKKNEYMIISRVGKPVCFQVLGFAQDNVAILSRKAAMLDARSYFLNTLCPGDIVPAQIVNTTGFGAFCDIGCGFTALLPIQRCCISRLQTAANLFHVSQHIYASVLDIKELEGRIVLSTRELLGTWEENAANYQQGQTVTGIVRSVMPYGIFVELTPNLSGLAEYIPGFAPGDSVSVFLRAILPDKHKIKMNILEKLPRKPFINEPEFYITSGHIAHWAYFPGSKAVTCF